MNIAEQIKKFRVKEGLSRDDLASLLGVSPSAVAAWEYEKWGVSHDNMMKLQNLGAVSANGTTANSTNGTSASSKNNLREVAFCISRVFDEKGKPHVRIEGATFADDKTDQELMRWRDKMIAPSTENRVVISKLEIDEAKWLSYFTGTVIRE